MSTEISRSNVEYVPEYMRPSPKNVATPSGAAQELPNSTVQAEHTNTLKLRTTKFFFIVFTNIEEFMQDFYYFLAGYLVAKRLNGSLPKQII